MKKNKEYHKYTEYDQEPGGLRKLDFIVEILKKRFGKKENNDLRILDYGCGKGNVSLPIASLQYQVLGMDIDQKSIEYCNQINDFDNAAFEIGDYADLKIDEKFDCIITSEVIEHLKKPDLFLKIIRKNINYDGIMIITIPNGYSLEENIRRFTTHTGVGRWIKKQLRRGILKKEEMIQTKALSPHLHFFSLNRFQKLLKENGYEVIEVKNSAFIFKESFYLFLRLFVKRGSDLFHKIDELDNKWSDSAPKCIGDGWMIVVKPNINI